MNNSAARDITLGKHYSHIHFTNGTALAVVMEDELREKPERVRQRAATAETLRQFAEDLGLALIEDQRSETVLHTKEPDRDGKMGAVGTAIIPRAPSANGDADIEEAFDALKSVAKLNGESDLHQALWNLQRLWSSGAASAARARLASMLDSMREALTSGEGGKEG